MKRSPQITLRAPAARSAHVDLCSQVGRRRNALSRFLALLRPRLAACSSPSPGWRPRRCVAASPA